MAQDLSQLSDEELRAIAGVSPGISDLSDEELQAIAGDVSRSTFTQEDAERAFGGSSVAGPLAEFSTRSFTDNALATPGALVELAGGALANTAAAVNTAGGAALNTITGREPEAGIIQRFLQEREQQRNLFPASAAINNEIPRPTTFDLQAFSAAYGNALGNTPMVPGTVNPMLTTDFEDARDQALENSLQRREESPIAAGAGEVLGDAASVAAGRAPFVAAARRKRLAGRADEAVESSTDSLARIEIEPGARQFLDDIVNSKLADNLKAGGYKIGEAGFEGALLAAVQDEDPLASAALAAGSQTAGSLVLQGFENIPPKNSVAGKLAFLAITGTALIQLFKAATPGGRDRILESEEASYEKLVALIGLGAAASAFGAGRPNQRQLDQLGAFIDSTNSVRRGTLQSLLSDFADDSEGRIEPILQQMARDPDYFSKTAQRRINRALSNEDVSLNNTIDTLMTDRRFRRRLNDLRTQ